MEAMGEWSTSLQGGILTDEVDFMNQLLASYELPCGGSSSGKTATFPTYHRRDSSWNSGFCFSRESSSYSGHYTVVPRQEETKNWTEDLTVNTNLYLVGEETHGCDVAEYSGKSLLPLETVEENHDHNVVQPEVSLTLTSEEKLFSQCESSKKRTCPTSIDKNKRVNKARRSQKNIEMSGDNDNSGEDEHMDHQSARKRKAKSLKQQKTYCSDDESNGRDTSFSKEDCENSKTLNVSGKTRASGGAATDPQSLYARKRRERINERLRILQNLVPNGTKVDISTMLEEAVQYVKFLQLQIKLLSSDDLWMFAPIAYNGMDIGLDQQLNALT